MAARHDLPSRAAAQEEIGKPTLGGQRANGASTAMNKLGARKLDV